MADASSGSSGRLGFGVDIGGSGIKATLVDMDAGDFAAERKRIETPAGARPNDVAAVVAELVEHFDWQGPVGAAFPAVVQRGVARTAANVDKSWIDRDVAALLSDAIGGSRQVTVLNDADAAGLAEVRFGAGRDVPGVVILCTLGTGIGTAVLLNGTLVPNTELGHLEVDGHDAETRAADSARDREDLSWEQWAKRVSTYLQRLEALLWPDLILLGGGVSKKADKFLPLLQTRTPVRAAELRNKAGIIGAAIAAAEAPVGVGAGASVAVGAGVPS